MISFNKLICPDCGKNLKYYDNVNRIIYRKMRTKDVIKMNRYKCNNCKKIHRELMEDTLPFKQYEFSIIQGVLEELITNDTIGFEDYPCEMTTKRWKKNKEKIYKLINLFELDEY